MSAAASQPVSRPLAGRARVARVLRRPAAKALIAAQGIVALVIILRSLGWLQPVELAVYDRLRVAWAGHRVSDSVVLVGATEGDIARWGWPLRDGDLADLLERLAAGKPRAIGVDIYRDRPLGPGSDKLDAVLAHHSEIYWVFKLGGEAGGGIPPPKLLRGTERAAFADIPADSGDTVRRALLFAAEGEDNHAGMATALALRYLAHDGIALAPTPDGDLRLGKVLIHPLDDTQGPYLDLDGRGYQMLLDYQGGPQPFRMKSVAAIMNGTDSAAFVRDRIVLVGVTSESVKDFFTSPFSTAFGGDSRVYGIAVHGDIADQLIREATGETRPLTALPRRAEDLWIWAWAMGGALLGLMWRTPTPAVGAMAALMTALGGTVYAAFGAGLLLPAVPAALASVAAAGATNRLLYAASNRERAMLRQIFEHYLHPSVIDDIVAAETPPKLGGERREITILFTDVEGFTTLSEAMDPEGLAALVNDYFEGVCGAILAEGGLIAKFIGDAVMALFGAPNPQPDHADHAVAAALAIQAYARRFSAEQRARGIDFRRTRIGIHTGPAMVGNIGIRSRLEYGALGDSLNTAARLEGLNKYTGTDICVSGDTVKQCRNHIFRPIAVFQVKGKSSVTEVFQPVDARLGNTESTARYMKAYGALEADTPEAATALFAALRYDYPDDPCVALHCTRLAGGERGTLIEMGDNK